MAKHYNWYQWHSLVDSIYCFLVTKLSAGQFFRKGWGDKDTFNKQQRLFLEKLKQCKEARNLGEPLKGLSVTNLKWTYESNCLEFSSAGMDKKQFWLWNRVAEVWKLHLREGCFPSPAIEWLNETESLSSFPQETRMARFLLLEPTQSCGSTVVIHLAATGDHGYNRRLFFFALPLASCGISSVILENPYYGSRKPAHQPGSKLSYVQDLLLLGFATILECMSIAKYLSEYFGYSNVCFSGLSQGGLHAAMAASLYPWPVATVAALSPHSAVPVFTKGALRQSCSWNQLAETLKEYDYPLFGMENDNRMQEIVQYQLSSALDMSDIRHFPQPANPSAAILLAGEYDKYVPKECIETFSKAWPNMEIRWIPSGHVTGFLFYRQHIFQAILDSLARV